MNVQAPPPHAREVLVPKMYVPLSQAVLTLLYSKQPLQQARWPLPPQSAASAAGANRSIARHNSPIVVTHFNDMETPLSSVGGRE